MHGFWLGWKNSLEKSRPTACLLISGSQVRALVRPPSLVRNQQLSSVLDAVPSGLGSGADRVRQGERRIGTGTAALAARLDCQGDARTLIPARKAWRRSRRGI